MDPDLVAIAARHVERLLIVLAGGLSIVLGYRMFLAIPKAQNDGEGKVQLPGGISIYVSRVGPGVFFALFGAIILSLGVHDGLRLERREQLAAAPSQAAAAGASTASAVTEWRYSSAVGPGGAGEHGEVERNTVLGIVGQLTRVAAVLDGPVGRELSAPQRNDFPAALSEARQRLLASVWDERAWGPHIEFVRWVQEGESGPPPKRATPAVRAFRGQ